MASFVTLRLSSRVASSSSSRTSALACSATLFVAVPRPSSRPKSVSWVCMAPPVEHLGKQDPRHERGTDDDDRRRAAALLLSSFLGLVGTARGRRRGRWRLRRLPRGALTAGARRDQARLQLAQERGILAQLHG